MWRGRAGSRAVRLAAVLLLWCTATGTAAAWGPAVHRAVALVADARLTPPARRQVRRLLGTASMADASTWADEVREGGRAETVRWHFVNIPLEARGYAAARDCRPTRAGDCIVAALERVERDLRDGRIGSPRRADALRFAVHLVADLHQPLHAADGGDRGGTRRQVTVRNRSVTLHAAWDGALIGADGPSLAAAAGQWLERQDVAAFAGGSYADWANESFRLARDVAYPQAADGRITQAERVEALRIVQERIGRAAVRLAAILNRTLGTLPAPR